jgi:hypothetical protein
MAGKVSQMHGEGRGLDRHHKLINRYYIGKFALLHHSAPVAPFKRPKQETKPTRGDLPMQIGHSLF